MYAHRARSIATLLASGHPVGIESSCSIFAVRCSLRGCALASFPPPPYPSISPYHTTLPSRPTALGVGRVQVLTNNPLAVRLGSLDAAAQKQVFVPLATIVLPDLLSVLLANAGEPHFVAFVTRVSPGSKVASL